MTPKKDKEIIPAPKPKKQSKETLEKSDERVIYLTCQSDKVVTTDDGGWKITFAGSGQIESVMKFFKITKAPGIIVEIVAVAVDTDGEKEPENKVHY